VLVRRVSSGLLLLTRTPPTRPKLFTSSGRVYRDAICRILRGPVRQSSNLGRLWTALALEKRGLGLVLVVCFIISTIFNLHGDAAGDRALGPNDTVSLLRL
jgi:hypothetical protein